MKLNSADRRSKVDKTLDPLLQTKFSSFLYFEILYHGLYNFQQNVSSMQQTCIYFVQCWFSNTQSSVWYTENIQSTFVEHTNKALFKK